MTNLRLLASTAGIALLASAAQADFTLTILHTNDFHDRFEPINGFDSTCSDEDAEAGECFGGIARLMTAVTDARARAGNSILLDAGDQFQGSLLFTLYKGAMSAEFMPQVGYDAMAVGNHEFNDGPATLGAFIDAVGLPVLAANIDASREPALAGRIGKSTVVEVGGERIGIVGLTTTTTPEIASPGPNVNFLPYDSAQAEIDALTEDGVNKIILLTHTGYDEDQALVEALSGVDVIVGGHSHTLLSNTEEGAAGPYPTMVNDVPIVQARSYGKYLGELTVTFDDEGNVLSAQGEPILLDASVAEDEAARARVEELAQPIEELRSEVVAEAADAIDGERESCRAVECEMGNLVAEAMLDRVADQGIAIAIANGGGLRASIDAGEVTMGEVLTVLPFQNTLSTFQVSGQTVIDALENGASQIEEGGGRFAQVAGLRYTIDPSQPAGSRVSEVQVMGEDGSWTPIDPAATYGVVSNNFVRGGGDGYAMFVDAQNAYDFGPDLAEVTADYLAANQPYEPFTDGRITMMAGTPAADGSAEGDAAAEEAASGAEAAPAEEAEAEEVEDEATEPEDGADAAPAEDDAEAEADDEAEAPAEEEEATEEEATEEEATEEEAETEAEAPAGDDAAGEDSEEGAEAEAEEGSGEEAEAPAEGEAAEEPVPAE